MKMLIVLLMLATLSTAFIGCETTEGLGRDVREVGEDIEDAAN